VQYTFSNDGAVALTGELTFKDHPAFRTMITQLLKVTAPSAAIDVSRLEFIDSSGLGMLLVARDEAKKTNHTLVLRHPTGQVKRMFGISKFETLFSVQP
jgi:HptB-dependent secretion and biofilm anti anti-sigma factor